MVGTGELRVVHTHRWLRVLSSVPLVVPADVRVIPGVRHIEPEPGLSHPTWVLEIPSTASMLPAAQRWSGLRVPQQVPRPATPELYEHQRDGIAFLQTNSGGLLADAVGLGKTRQALHTAAYLADGRPNPILVCGPKYVASTWAREITQTFGDRYRFIALEGIKPAPIPGLPAREPVFLYCHYDIVFAWWSQIAALQPRVTILDEAHLVKNRKTRRGRAAALAVSTATSRILLTGTPLMNRPSELFTLLELATGKWTWGTPSQFRMRYCGAMRDGHGLKDGEPTHVEELRARLSSCMIRRTVEDLDIDLPPLRREIIHVDLTPEAAAQYEERLDGIPPVALLQAILQRRGSRETFTALGKLRALASDAKLEATKSLLADLSAQDEHVVVFSWQRKTAKQLARNDMAVHGERPIAEREALIDRFQRDGGRLSATLDALSTGVTLDRARIVVLHDLGWVPATLLQAEGRVTGGLRRGTKHCVSFWLVARNTLDELMVKLISEKASIIEQMMQDEGPSDLARSLDDAIGRHRGSHLLERAMRWAEGLR